MFIITSTQLILIINILTSLIRIMCLIRHLRIITIIDIRIIVRLIIVHSHYYSYCCSPSSSYYYDYVCYCYVFVFLLFCLFVVVFFFVS